MPLTDHLGPYQIIRLLGRGGMGEVYLAEDGRLGRTVALKVIASSDVTPVLARRFAQEARAASSVTHPNVAQIYEFGESDGMQFIAMEYVDGQPLSALMHETPVETLRLLDIGIQIAEGLASAHAKGTIHRDVKLANIILTPSGGVKILDFGLATFEVTATSNDSATAITDSGVVMGTVDYMSPEQAFGKRIDARSDLFSFGVILYALSTGRLPFTGASVTEKLDRIIHHEPDAIARFNYSVPPELERIVRKMLEKEPERRYQSAREVAIDLRNLLRDHQSGRVTAAGRAPAAPEAPRRVVVLPFRLLKNDPDIDFLSISLAEAITGSLSSLASLVVRSTLTIQHLTAGAVDLKRLGEELSVDAVVSGTILRSGDRLRIGTQLIAVPEGNVLWSHSSQVVLADIFEIEDNVTREVIRALAVPLSDTDAHVLSRDRPASVTAHEFFLRANAQPHNAQGWRTARDLYVRSLDEDSRYAPAWARLAQCYFRIGKYTDEPGDHYRLAEAAVRRALDVNPDLAVAHRTYAMLELELGRTLDALRRLLGLARRTKSDPDLFSGLVQVLRYCGLLEASVLAHEHAVRLAPQSQTSVAHTYWMLGRHELALGSIHRDIGYIEGVVLSSMGREEEAISRLREHERVIGDPRHRLWITQLRATLERNEEEAVRAIRSLSLALADPESTYHMARACARLELRTEALDLLRRSVDRGFYASPIFRTDPWLDACRPAAEFDNLASDAARHMQEAAAIYEDAGGSGLINPL